MKSATSQQSRTRPAAEPKPLLVLRAGGGSSDDNSSAADAVMARATPTQTLASTSRQPASVRFRSETRLEYGNP